MEVSLPKYIVVSLHKSYAIMISTPFTWCTGCGQCYIFLFGPVAENFRKLVEFLCQGDSYRAKNCFKYGNEKTDFFMYFTKLVESIFNILNQFYNMLDQFHNVQPYFNVAGTI